MESARPRAGVLGRGEGAAAPIKGVECTFIAAPITWPHKSYCLESAPILFIL